MIADIMKSHNLGTKVKSDASRKLSNTAELQNMGAQLVDSGYMEKSYQPDMDTIKQDLDNLVDKKVKEEKNVI